MSKVDFEGKKPKVDESVFLAPGSWVVGDVTIKEGANVWNGAVIRGDDDTVEIGARATILENCVVEAPTGSPMKIGDEAIVSHGAIVHGANVGARALVGIGAIVLDGAEVGEGSIIGSGAVVSPRMVIPLTPSPSASRRSSSGRSGTARGRPSILSESESSRRSRNIERSTRVSDPHFS